MEEIKFGTTNYNPAEIRYIEESISSSLDERASQLSDKWGYDFTKGCPFESEQKGHVAWSQPKKYEL
jgi:hypothetical protein